MNIATQTDRLGQRLGDEKAIKMICESGFDAIDYSMFFMTNKPDHPLNGEGMIDYILKLKAVAEKYNVPFHQSHAPFPSMKKDDDAFNKLQFKRICDALQVSSMLGVNIMVVHPACIDYDNVSNDFDVNVKFYKTLIPYIEQYGVKVALENMWGNKDGKPIPLSCGTAESFKAMMDALDPQYFVACLDIGHCGMVGQKPADMIRALGHKHLHALHVHDNDNTRDSHIFPFNGKVNWNETMKALAEIDYDGDLTFEADNSFITSPASFLPTQAKYLHDIGTALVGMMKK